MWGYCCHLVRCKFVHPAASVCVISTIFCRWIVRLNRTSFQQRSAATRSICHVIDIHTFCSEIYRFYEVNCYRIPMSVTSLTPKHPRTGIQKYTNYRCYYTNDIWLLYKAPCRKTITNGKYVEKKAIITKKLQIVTNICLTGVDEWKDLQLKSYLGVKKMLLSLLLVNHYQKVTSPIFCQAPITHLQTGRDLMKKLEPLLLTMLQTLLKQFKWRLDEQDIFDV